MPAAQSKLELLSKAREEYQKLLETIGNVAEAKANIKDEDDTSIKDVLAHRAHWVSLFLGWYRDGQANKEVFFPARGYKWNQLKEYNRNLREEQRELSWVDAIALLDRAHSGLLELIESMSESDLYGAPMKGARNTWTTGRWAEASGPSHYRSANKYIRTRIKTL